MMISH